MAQTIKRQTDRNQILKKRLPADNKSLNPPFVSGAGEKRRLVLIEPKAPGMHVYSKLKLPRLGAVLLGTIMRDQGWEVKIYVEEIAPIDYQEVLKAHVVGISTITSTATRAYAIADALRSFNIPLVMGGPHTTFLPEEALDHCDFVVRGEGEEVFPALLQALFSEGDFSTIAGLSFRTSDGLVCHNPVADRLTDLEALPFADFNLIVGWTRTKSFGFKKIIPIQASRGCPFACKFCSVVGMFGRKMRWRSTAHIVKEMAQYSDKNTHIFFYDDNFTASPARAKEIIREARARGIQFVWSAQTRTDIARDDDMLQLMKDSNCSGLYIGFESANPASLKEMNKSQTVEDMAFSVKKFAQYGVKVHGMFVFGFDSDTRQSCKETIKFAKKSGIHSAQFLILTPLPGTPLFDQMKSEKRLTLSDWSLYDAHHVVFKPKNISPLVLQYLQIKGHTQFYSLGQMLKQMASAYFEASVIYLYARRANAKWKKSNRFYLKALKLAERAKGFKLSFDLKAQLDDIKAQVQSAARLLAYAY